MRNDGKLSFEEFQKAMQENTNATNDLEAYAGLGGDGLKETDRVDAEIQGVEEADDEKVDG